MRATIRHAAVAMAVFAACRTPATRQTEQADDGWPERVAASLAEGLAPSVRVSRGGLRVWQATGVDPRLPLPVALQPRGRAFLAVLAEVRPEDVPRELPGLPALLAGVGPETRARVDGSRVAVAARAFERGIALTPLVTDQGVGWLASFHVDAGEPVVAAAADLLLELASSPGFSSADVAARAETLRATMPRPCAPDAVAAIAAGLTGPIGDPASADTLERAHREDLVRLHRRIFAPRGLVLVGTRPWPLRAEAGLEALTTEAPASLAETAGPRPVPAEADCPRLVALSAALLAGEAGDELATPWSLRDGRFAQVAWILDWLAPTSLERLPELRRLGPFGAPRDVLVGDAAAFSVLARLLDAAGPALDMALRPLEPGASVPPSTLLRGWMRHAAAQ